MKRLLAIAAALPVLAFLARAQDDNSQIRMMKLDAERVAAQAKIVSVRSAVMGKTVKDAPYSATEITEMNQVLADGTHIHNETQAQVYRDSEGRTRRETADSVTIWDPVAKVTYVLNPKDQTARQMPLGDGVFFFARDGQASTFTMKMPPPLPDPQDIVKLKAEKDAVVAESKMTNRAVVTSDAIGGGVMTERLDVVAKDVAPGTPESLGTQNIEGVTAQGTRTTTTIPLNAIGNDRPLQIVNERWFSPDLQKVVQSRFSDPRSGEETFRMTNVSRTEPPAYLFQVPAGYQIQK
jgi:hypothetical protein